MKDATVLCVTRDSLKEKYSLPQNGQRALIPVNQDQILNHTALVVLNRLVVDSREEDKHKKGRDNPQLLPYIVLKHKGKILTYSRAEGAEERLRANRSFGFGGHMDISEEHGIETYEQLQKLLVEDAQREVLEEIGISISKVDFTHLIADESDHVGKVHLGILGQIELTDEQFNSIEAEQTEIVDPQWFTLDEIATDYSRYESWSQMIFDMLKN